MTPRLETGVDLLDRRLNGGVPNGSITALLSPPASQSELLLYEFASVRPTLYISTVRAADAVRDVMAQVEMGHDDVVVTSVDTDALVAETLELVGALPDASTLIVDPIGAFERLSRGEYREFLIELRRRLADANAVGFFNCLTGHETSPRRETTEYVADVVFRLTTDRRGESVENYLTVPKYRGGEALEDVLKLSLTTEVDVDISRNLV